MRLILTILLIGLFKADAQIVINASAPYKPLDPFGCGDTTRLLDSYTGSAAAYSLRKLRAGYTGAAIRVRKDTTGQPEQDIFFNLCGNLDTAALISFLNARSGFVVTWYDQSGNTRNATNATQATQPRIANLGIIERLNGKPTLRWVNGLNQVLRTSTINPSISQPITFFSVANLTASTGINASILLDNGTNTAGQFIFYSTGNTETPNNTFRLGAGSAFGSVLQNTNTNLLYGLFNTTSSAYSLNNNAEITGNAGNNSLNGITIGNLRSGVGLPAYDWSGNISELIIYNSNQSTNKTNINNNINSFYSIY